MNTTIPTINNYPEPVNYLGTYAILIIVLAIVLIYLGLVPYLLYKINKNLESIKTALHKIKPPHDN